MDSCIKADKILLVASLFCLPAWTRFVSSLLIKIYLLHPWESNGLYELTDQLWRVKLYYVPSLLLNTCNLIWSYFFFLSPLFYFVLVLAMNLVLFLFVKIIFLSTLNSPIFSLFFFYFCIFFILEVDCSQFSIF